jgi:hypothetical protein
VGRVCGLGAEGRQLTCFGTGECGNAGGVLLEGEAGEWLVPRREGKEGSRVGIMHAVRVHRCRTGLLSAAS